MTFLNCLHFTHIFIKIKFFITLTLFNLLFFYIFLASSSSFENGEVLLYILINKIANIFNFYYILLFVVLDLLTYEDYKHYRSQHPGPLSERSFNKWCRNVGIDEPSFKWRAHPYQGVGGHQRKNSNQKVVNVFYQ